MLSMLTLWDIQLFAIAAAILGTICIIGIFVCQVKYTVKTKKHVNQIGESGVAIENTKLTIVHNIFVRMGIIFYGLAVVSLLIYGIIFAQAIKYGAYGDFNKKNTLADIKYNIEHGFVDQSNELPDDLKGCVIIFFKWGCADCANVHDDLLAALDNYDLFKTYFVSSRSQRGQEIIEQYPIEEVPSIIYIRYEPAGGYEYQYRSLHDGTSFDAYNLDVILGVQEYIRIFELPDEYIEDEIDEIPESYSNDYIYDEYEETDDNTDVIEEDDNGD